MLTDLLRAHHGIVVVGGEDSIELVMADYRTMPNTWMGKLVIAGEFELRTSLRSDPDVVYYVGHYLDPDVLERIMDTAMTGHAVCIAVPGSFEAAFPILNKVYNFDHGVEIVDGTGAAL